jgi:hypothetical protein
MSKKRAKPDAFSHKTAIKATKWAQKRAQWNLGAWKIRVIVGDQDPAVANDYDAVGVVRPRADHKEATIVVRPKNAVAAKMTPLATLFHEIGHIVLIEAGLPVEDQGEDAEHFCNRFAAVNAKAYTAG